MDNNSTLAVCSSNNKSLKVSVFKQAGDRVSLLLSLLQMSSVDGSAFKFDEKLLSFDNDDIKLDKIREGRLIRVSHMRIFDSKLPLV